MATIVKRPYGYQLRISHRLLPKDLWATFDTKEAAEQYARQLEGLLAQGIVPAALLERETPKQEIWTVQRCILEYLRHNSVPLSDQKLLDTVMPSVAKIGTGSLNYDWAEAWVRDMKRINHLAPGTIRKRQGALARCFDWMTRKHPEIMAQNPLRLLKRGFATYTEADADLLAAQGKAPRVDEERDRRVCDDEEARIVAFLQESDDERLFFELALQSAMRMRECYTLYVSQVDLPKRTIFLDRTKNGSTRQVPLPTPIVQHLSTYIRNNRKAITDRENRIFPYWSGDRDGHALDVTTRNLSIRFARIFRLAGVLDLHFHDLRHEATCRLYERTKLSDVLIAKITGHKDIRMLRRYASLRGSDLAAHLW
ncbi:site-specific integrase [Massilia norwichensis]|uniref:Site-specific integrase n=1 Tax=Massilia norwichensis TaxID=1442366 RepID=A0ABT2AF12_9BURK|nr:site-specific integrase [Massilia norwichensis]MCS0592365.1 site-specific integrase [Massilia norwichensis]